MWLNLQSRVFHPMKLKSLKLVFITIIILASFTVSCQTGEISETTALPEFVKTPEVPNPLSTNQHFPPPTLKFQRISTDAALNL